MAEKPTNSFSILQTVFNWTSVFSTVDPQLAGWWAACPWEAGFSCSQSSLLPVLSHGPLCRGFFTTWCHLLLILQKSPPHPNSDSQMMLFLFQLSDGFILLRRVLCIREGRCRRILTASSAKRKVTLRLPASLWSLSRVTFQVMCQRMGCCLWGKAVQIPGGASGNSWIFQKRWKIRVICSKRLQLLCAQVVNNRLINY